jgi:hypothetical protein
MRVDKFSLEEHCADKSYQRMQQMRRPVSKKRSSSFSLLSESSALFPIKN